MKESLNFYSSEKYNTEIEEIVERTSMSYLDAMLYHADENGLESETVAGLINVKTKNKLREEAEKLNWMARYVLSMIIVLTFLFLIWLLFYGELPAASRDLVNIMVGAYVAVLAKATDYWFKDKDDPEQKEGEAVGNGNNDTI